MSRSENLVQAQDWLGFLNHNKGEGFYEDTGFGVVKLNGSAKIKVADSESIYLFDGDRRKTKSDDLKQLIERYIKAINTPDETSLISFAWETNVRELSKTLTPFLANTEVLAIIGYSFPFFNRQIDIELIKMMKKLRKIYIQDIDPNGIQERLFQIIDSDMNDNEYLVDQSVLNYNVGQFVFPKELEM